MQDSFDLSGGRLGSLREQLAQDRESGRHRFLVDRSEPLDEPPPVKRAKLLGEDKAVLARKMKFDPKRRRAASGRKRDDSAGPEVLVQAVGRNHQARARLLDFAADRGVERGEPDLAPLYHSRAASSSLANSGQAGASSSAVANASAASAHPARTPPRTGLATMRPFSTPMSSGSPALAPSAASTALGTIMPVELPIRRRAVRVVASITAI